MGRGFLKFIYSLTLFSNTREKRGLYKVININYPNYNFRLTHATPAALYAHSANRDWECDSSITDKSVVPEETSLKDQVILTN